MRTDLNFALECPRARHDQYRIWKDAKREPKRSFVYTICQTSVEAEVERVQECLEQNGYRTERPLNDYEVMDFACNALMYDLFETARRRGIWAQIDRIYGYDRTIDENKLVVLFLFKNEVDALRFRNALDGQVKL